VCVTPTTTDSLSSALRWRRVLLSLAPVSRTRSDGRCSREELQNDRRSASAQPLHSRPWHLFLRLHTSLFVLLALAGGVFLASGDPILVVGGVLLLFCAPAAFWLLSGRYWAVYLTPTELVARRLFRTRRVPRSALKAIIKPWYARSLYGFYW
jgi:hypothetical protein